MEGHEPEAVERRAVQPLESPLRQPERSPAATNTFGGQNCGEEGGGVGGSQAVRARGPAGGVAAAVPDRRGRGGVRRTLRKCYLGSSGLASFSSGFLEGRVPANKEIHERGSIGGVHEFVLVLWSGTQF